jgi:1-deoxy-D-xylulose-5-phosphate reductoisomerase
MNKKKNIILLGATGSIGESSLRLLRKNKEKFNLIGVSAHNNAELLSKIVNEFDVPNVVLSDPKNTKLYYGKNDLNVGQSSLIELAKINCDIVISGIIGMSGLYPAFSAISVGNNLAIANKETLVSAGKIFMEKSLEKKVKILPVDSEHSAIFQCLEKNNISNVDFITLTASGGPFFNMPIENFKNIKPRDAIKHPVWKMGQKISVDSATMFNKALEIIEASVLFNIKSDKIEVTVHPEHIIHGLVHYKDGSIIANLGFPDMITPLSVALNWPTRIDLNLKKLSLNNISNLSFFEPDFKKFPGLKLGWDVLDNPNFSPVVLNASNEIAVDAFLNNKIRFPDIYNVVYETLNVCNPSVPQNIGDIIEIDKIARMNALKLVKRIFYK